MKSYHIVLSFLLVTFFSCQLDPCMDKESFLKSYNSFIQDIEQADDQSISNWKPYDEKFEKYINECYQRHETTLTLKEKKDFWIKSMKYYREKYGEDFYDKLDEDGDILGEKIASEIEKVFDNSTQDALEYIREVYGDDIENTIDKAVDEIGKLGEELKNILAK